MTDPVHVHFKLATRTGLYTPTFHWQPWSFCAPVDPDTGQLLEPDGAGGYDVLPDEVTPKIDTDALRRWLS